jgi:Amt family ammonium transporter
MAEAAAASSDGTWTVWNQLGVQALAVGIAVAFAAAMTFAIIFVLSRFMKFRSTEDDEMAGLDRTYHGERGYGMLNPN